MRTITPFLWYDQNAEAALDFYVSCFPNSKRTSEMRCSDAGPYPKGTLLSAGLELAGQKFAVLNGGPAYQLNPAISLFVNCASAAELDQLWSKLSADGVVMMPVGEYPFSPRFGWLQDRFGLSWQFNLGARPQKLTPFLMFCGPQHGKAAAAIDFYTRLFPHSGVEKLDRFGARDFGPEGTVKHAIFKLAGLDFMATDAAGEHPFTFNEGFSLMVECETQAEVDELWNKLTADGGAESRCGWLKDKFGVSWQITPKLLLEYMRDPNPAKAAVTMRAMMQMGKIDIQKLKDAYASA